MNARYYAFALTGRALTRLCQLPRVALRSALGYGLLPFQGVHSTCVTCIQPEGRAFNLRDVHSTCLRPKILRSVMVEILRDSCQNIVRIVTKKMLGSYHNIFWQLAEDHSAARTIPRCPLSSLYKELSNGITTTVVVIPLGLTISVGSGFGSDTSSHKSVSLHVGEANLTPLLSQSFHWRRR